MTATVPLFAYDPREYRQAALIELEGHGLAYIEGYMIGYTTALEKYTVAVILTALNAMRPQPSNGLATAIYQKLRFYHRYIPTYDEMASKKFKPDTRSSNQLAFKPVSHETNPEFQAGQEAGAMALSRFYQRFLDYFRENWAKVAPSEVPWIEESQPDPVGKDGKPLSDIELTSRQRIMRYIWERDARAAKLDAEMRETLTARAARLEAEKKKATATRV